MLGLGLDYLVKEHWLDPPLPFRRPSAEAGCLAGYWAHGCDRGCVEQKTIQWVWRPSEAPKRCACAELP